MPKQRAFLTPKKKETGFYQKLLFVFLAVLLVIAVGLGVLWVSLADYQSALPRNFAETISQAYRAFDGETVAKYCTNLPAVLRADVPLFSAYLKENLGTQEVYFYEGSAKSADEVVYELNGGKNKLATLTLRKTQQKTLFGRATYEVVSLVEYPFYPYTIVAPSGVEVQIDGQPVSAVADPQQAQVATSFTEIGVSPFYENTYTLTDFTYIKEITAQRADGVPCTIERDDATHTITVSTQPGDTMRAELEAFATDFSKKYIVFATAYHGDRAPVLAVVPKGTALREAVRSYGNEWGEKYVSDRYENLNVSEYRAYSDTEYSCYITLDYIIHKASGKEKAYDFDFVLYASKASGKWQMVGMQAK